eukprot:3756386-Rhodomonas_salina.1
MTLTVKDLLYHSETLSYLGYEQGRSILYCDNEATIALSEDPVHRGRSKHISRRCFWIRQHTTERGDILPIHVVSDENIGDVFTNPLSEEKFTKFSHALVSDLGWRLPSQRVRKESAVTTTFPRKVAWQSWRSHPQEYGKQTCSAGLWKESSKSLPRGMWKRPGSGAAGRRRTVFVQIDDACPVSDPHPSSHYRASSKNAAVLS